MRGRVLVIGLLGLVASALAGPGTAAAACQQWTGANPQSPGSQENTLTSVVVLGPCNAYAVGAYNDGGGDVALMERFNGTAWRQVTIPTPGSASTLEDVSSSWAVGNTFDPSSKTYILRRVGSSWAQITSPNPSGTSNALHGVVQLAPGNAWAVGAFQNGVPTRTLVVHWNGTKWKHVASPNAGDASTSNGLAAIDAASGQDIWAVGTTGNFPFATLTLHWNGNAWKRIPSPTFGMSGAGSFLTGVAALSSDNVWASGHFDDGGLLQAMILHWNGSKWRRVKLPNLGSTSVLQGIRALGRRNIWAVGENDLLRNLVLHWNGRAWKKVAVASPGAIESIFYGIDGTPNDMWVVGKARDTGTEYYTQAQHCC